VFVMLTFVLAVTTYLFFREKLNADVSKQEAEKKMVESNAALANSETEKNKLKQILGFEEKQSVAEIETQVNELFEKNHEDFKEDSKSYSSFSRWLLESNEAKDKATADQKKKADELEEELKRAREAAAKREKDLEARALKKEQEAADLQKDFDARWEEHASRSKSLTEGQQKALDQASRLKLLEEEIAKGDSLLAPSRLARFKTKPAEERVAILLEELRDQEKLIARQNDVLAELRVADKKLQDAVLAATPADDRVEGLDGRILSVNEVDRTVLIDVGSTRGLRPGLVMRVYDPGDPRPQVGDFKAVVEVVAVESSALARARIRSDAVGDPILPGDRVATSLWSPDGTFEAVIVGFVQLDADQKADQDRLQELIERIGGRAEPAVSTTTTMVIDAGLPQSPGGVLERAAGWRAADEARRDKQTKEARRLGIRVVGIDAFLEMMGLDRSALDSNRLPRLGSQQAPVIPGGVAY